MGKLFIPEKCRVGFQQRKDTFTNKLAYVIYYDSFGKIRKEKSWKGWCHLPGEKQTVYNYDTCKHEEVDPIEPFDFENTPTSGFVLNKGIQRYNWSYFGSGRSMIRIYDPRGIEFEITPENLIGLLMHTDCSKREVQGDLVYAWNGGKLMLLPCKSEEYEAAKSFTALQATKIGARELKEGLTYSTKQEEHLVYLGRHMLYQNQDGYVYGPYSDKVARTGVKQHIFCDLQGTNCRAIKSVPTKIAAVVNEHCHDDFANWVDMYLASIESSKIIGWFTEPLTESDWDKDWSEYHASIHACVRMPNGTFATASISNHRRYHNQPRLSADHDGLTYSVYKNINEDGSHFYNSSRHDHHAVTDRSMFFHLYAEFENGSKLKWNI